LNSLSGKIRLDFRSAEPLYLQIAGQIEQMVVRGDLKVSDQLPTVRELAMELRINFNTVARAYRFLDEARLISTQRGRGTYIWEEPTSATLEQLRRLRLNEMTSHYLEGIRRLGFTLEEAMDAFQAFQDQEQSHREEPESDSDGINEMETGENPA
jgi:GntR family transcriptional regulator